MGRKACAWEPPTDGTWILVSLPTYHVTFKEMSLFVGLADTSWWKVHVLLEIQGCSNLQSLICRNLYNTAKLNPARLAGESIDLGDRTSMACLGSRGYHASWFRRLGLQTLVCQMGIIIKTFLNYMRIREDHTH